jgi:Ca2+/Na+ antiporter
MLKYQTLISTIEVLLITVSIISVVYFAYIAKKKILLPIFILSFLVCRFMMFTCLSFNLKSWAWGIVLALCRCYFIIFVYIRVLIRYIIKNYIVFMDSAGKRKGTEGTARGKRKLEEQEEKGSNLESKKSKIDKSESDDAGEGPSQPSQSQLGPSQPSDYQPESPQPSQAEPSQPSQAEPSQPSHPQPGQLDPSRPGPSDPSGYTPPSLVHSGESAPEDDIPEGEGVPSDDNDDWMFDLFYLKIYLT